LIQETVASRRAAARRSPLLAFLAFPSALPFSNFAHLGAQALTLGTPLLTQPLALDALGGACFALRHTGFESRLACCLASRALGFLRTQLGSAAIDSRLALGAEERRLQRFTGNRAQFSHQSVDQTTILTLEMIHHVPFRVSHGTTAVVKRMQRQIEVTEGLTYGAVRSMNCGSPASELK
jgi:hypothetical protein